MQKSFNTKKKLFLAFFVALSTTGISTISAQEFTEQEDIADQLANILNSMPEQDQKQFKKLLKDVEDIENITSNESTKKHSECPTLLRKIVKTINNTISIFPYGQKIVEFSVYLALAVFWWEVVQPKLKERFDGWETATELPKAIGGVLIVDCLKDLVKAFRKAFAQELNISVSSSEEVEIII